MVSGDSAGVWVLYPFVMFGLAGDFPNCRVNLAENLNVGVLRSRVSCLSTYPPNESKSEFIQMKESEKVMREKDSRDTVLS